jgi:Na+-driven multidrug efflux pump
VQKVDFDNGRISRNILQTTLPMLVAQLLNLLYSIVDRIYIGRIPEAGTLALGAVGLCFPVVILITGFTNLYGMGGAPLFAMELGRGDREGAAVCQNTAFRLLLVTAAVLTVLGEVFSEPLLELFGATATEMPHALPYLRIYLLGTVFSMLAAGMNPFINAQGYSTLGMLTVVVGAAANTTVSIPRVE